MKMIIMHYYGTWRVNTLHCIWVTRLKVRTNFALYTVTYKVYTNKILSYSLSLWTSTKHISQNDLPNSVEKKTWVFLVQKSMVYFVLIHSILTLYQCSYKNSILLVTKWGYHKIRYWKNILQRFSKSASNTKRIFVPELHKWV